MTDSETRPDEEAHPGEREAETPGSEKDEEETPEGREAASEDDPEADDHEGEDEPEEDPTQPPEKVDDRSRVERGKGQGRRSNVQRKPEDQRGETDPKRRSSTT